MFFFDRFRQLVDRFQQRGTSRPGSIGSHRTVDGPARLEHFGWEEHEPVAPPGSLSVRRESQSFYRAVQMPEHYAEPGHISSRRFEEGGFQGHGPLSHGDPGPWAGVGALFAGALGVAAATGRLLWMVLLDHDANVMQAFSDRWFLSEVASNKAVDPMKGRFFNRIVAAFLQRAASGAQVSRFLRFVSREEMEAIVKGFPPPSHLWDSPYAVVRSNAADAAKQAVKLGIIRNAIVKASGKAWGIISSGDWIKISSATVDFIIGAIGVLWLLTRDPVQVDAPPLPPGAFGENIVPTRISSERKHASFLPFSRLEMNALPKPVCSARYV